MHKISMTKGSVPIVQVYDSKGNNFTYPKVVSKLPFSDGGSTYFFDDTFNLSCSDGGSGAYSRVIALYLCLSAHVTMP